MEIVNTLRTSTKTQAGIVRGGERWGTSPLTSGVKAGARLAAPLNIVLEVSAVMVMSCNNK